LQLPVRNNEGQVIDQIEVDDTVFGVAPNETVVHQALVRQLANSRLGTHQTKTRSGVSGSTRKLFRQKHTGMARAGSRRSPLRRGGGIVFGPHPRSYRLSMPKKMRRLALRSTLSAKVSDGELLVVDSFGLEQPSTKQIVHMFTKMDVGASVLLVTAEADMNVVKSARNMDGVATLPADMLNVVDVLSHEALVMTVDAVRRIEAIWGQKQVVAGAKAS